MYEEKIKLKDINGIKQYSNYKTMIVFDNMNEFIKYVETAKTSIGFEGSSLTALEVNDGTWTMCPTFEDAIKTAIEGWDAGITSINDACNKLKKNDEVNKKNLQYQSVCGHQAIVPLYLNGIPNNMVNKRVVQQKQKVVTINKLLGASGGMNAQSIIDEAIKCARIIKKIEASGVRVNLNVIMSPGADVFVKVRLKSAGERLNISKLAFPLCHPAMDRRLFFRFCETYPNMPTRYRNGYGSPPRRSDIQKILSKDEIVFPTSMYSLKGELETYTIDKLLEMLNK